MAPALAVSAFLQEHAFAWDGLYLKPRARGRARAAYHHLVSERSSRGEASLRIVHCCISSDFTVPKVITPATGCIAARGLVAGALGCSRNSMVSPGTRCGCAGPHVGPVSFFAACRLAAALPCTDCQDGLLLGAKPCSEHGSCSLLVVPFRQFL